jgi:hypothetical protein
VVEFNKSGESEDASVFVLTRALDDDGYRLLRLVTEATTSLDSSD